MVSWRPSYLYTNHNIKCDNSKVIGDEKWLLKDGYKDEIWPYLRDGRVLCGAGWSEWIQFTKLGEAITYLDGRGQASDLGYGLEFLIWVIRGKSRDLNQYLEPKSHWSWVHRPQTAQKIFGGIPDPIVHGLFAGCCLHQNPRCVLARQIKDRSDTPNPWKCSYKRTILRPNSKRNHSVQCTRPR